MTAQDSVDPLKPEGKRDEGGPLVQHDKSLAKDLKPESGVKDLKPESGARDLKPEVGFPTAPTQLRFSELRSLEQRRPVVDCKFNAWVTSRDQGLMNPVNSLHSTSMGDLSI